MTSLLRRVAALLLALTVILPAAPAAATDAPPRDAVPADVLTVMTNSVTWVIDHAAKTITATVRIQLGSACTRGQMARATLQGPAAAARCKVTPEIAKAIKDNVDAVWNDNRKVRCYSLKVITDIQIVETLEGPVAQSAATPADRAYVAIDQSPEGIRSFVSSYGTENWDSSSPADRMVAANGGAAPSVWKYPQTWESSLYAHEVGHILGMSDHYEDYIDPIDNKLHGRPRAGAPRDVMSDVETTTTDWSTLERLAARAGFGDYELKCDYTVDREVPGGRIRGTKCGGIEGDWVLTTNITQGIAHVEQTFTTTVRADRAVDTFTYTDTGRTETAYSVSTYSATAEGTAELSFLPNSGVRFVLTETKHRSRGSATVAGKTVTVPEADVPLVVWDWEWRLTTCAQP